MILITKKELKLLEHVRTTLNRMDYLKHSEQTGILYRIIYRRRNFKWLMDIIFK